MGTGKLEPAFIQKLEELDIKPYVKKIDHLPQDELPHLLNGSAYSIINSKYETGPRVALESMATSTPVISTKVGLLSNISAAESYIPIDRSIEDAISYAINTFGSNNYKKLQLKSQEFVSDYLCINAKVSVPKLIMELINE